MASFKLYREMATRLVMNRRFVFLVFILMAVAASIQGLLLAPPYVLGIPYTHYNNYLIFKHSFFHLLNGQDLYGVYHEYWDFYKYSPTFAVLMAPFAVLPDYLGLNLWNILNAGIFFLAIYRLPLLSDTRKGFVAWFVALELMTALQNDQSNALLAGMVMLAFRFSKDNKPIISTLLISLSVYIKLFSIVGFLFFFFSARKRKFFIWSVIWMGLLALVPLLIVSPDKLFEIYKSWISLLSQDHQISYGISFIGWLTTWFGWEAPKIGVVLFGTVVLVLPLALVRSWNNLKFGLLVLASLLIWMVLFNHKAESATYIIAMTGVAIWFFMKDTRRWPDVTLMVFAFILASVSPTDIFPRMIRERVVEPYVLKAVPVIFIWFRIQYDLFRIGRTAPKT